MDRYRADPLNPLYCLDYRSDAEMFAASGKDHAVNVYDETTKALVQKMGGQGSWKSGHSNRVFSLKFNPNDENILLSGGWDNTVQIWDVRAGISVRNIFGPHICGDAIDVQNGMILTGSWREGNQLQIWDFGSGKLIEDIPWNRGKSASSGACMLYAAKFNISGTLIGAGGSGVNEAKIFDIKRENAVVGTLTGLSGGVFSIDWTKNDTFAIGSGDHSIRIYSVTSSSGSKEDDSSTSKVDDEESKRDRIDGLN
jgi:COMPASS component SWD3